MYLEDMINNIRIELGDKTKVVWTDNDEITRAVEKAVSLMSRLTPKRDLIETTIVRDIDDETLTISSSAGTLAYKPIKSGSVVMTGKTLDTDYRIDYLTGIVTEIGSGLPDTDYTVSYELDPYILDLSSLLPDYIRLERVEYPVGDVPLSLLTFDVFGSSLVIRNSATTLSEDEHLRVIYLKKWTPPTPDADGDYPSHLDDIVIIGSTGQALIFKAEYYVHQAASAQSDADTLLTSLGSLDITLSSLTPPTAPTLTLPTAPTDYSFSKPSAPSLPSAPTPPSAPDISGDITSIGTALTAAIARFAAAVTTLGSMDTPLGDTNIALDQVDTELTAAIGYLNEGDDLINAATRGEDVGKTYGAYAGYRSVIASEYEKEAAQRVALALGWEAKAARDTTIGNSYLNEAIQRITVISRTLDKYEGEIKSYSGDVAQYSVEVGGVVDKFEGEIAAENSGVANFNAQISKFGNGIAKERAKVEKFQQEVINYGQQVVDQQNQINEFRSKAEKIKNGIDGYAAQAVQYLELAGRYLAGGQAKINEFLAALGIKPEFPTQKASHAQTPF